MRRRVSSLSGRQLGAARSRRGSHVVGPLVGYCSSSEEAGCNGMFDRGFGVEGPVGSKVYELLLSYVTEGATRLGVPGSWVGLGADAGLGWVRVPAVGVAF